MQKPEHVVGSRLLETGRYIAFKELEWMDAEGTLRRWESAERVDEAGSVLIIPRLMPSRRVVLIRQFRPPARGYVYEFPAGIMNLGEQPAEAAMRELREETGYVAHRVVVWPNAYTTPGLTNESVFMVEAEIDEEAQENINPQPQPDETENIEIFSLEEKMLPDFYLGALERGAMFDAKLATYILSMRLWLPQIDD